jgi:hypothetical protein
MSTHLTSVMLFQMITQVALFKHASVLESKSEPELIEYLKQIFDSLGIACPPSVTLEGILGALETRAFGPRHIASV